MNKMQLHRVSWVCPKIEIQLLLVDPLSPETQLSLMWNHLSFLKASEIRFRWARSELKGKLAVAVVLLSEVLAPPDTTMPSRMPTKSQAPEREPMKLAATLRWGT